MFRVLVTSEDAGGSYTTMEATVPPEEGANPHFHADEEERFYVLDGELTFEVDGQTIEVGTGDLLHVPRGVVHSFRNGDREAKLLATLRPRHRDRAGFYRHGNTHDRRGGVRIRPRPAATRCLPPPRRVTFSQR